MRKYALALFMLACFLAPGAFLIFTVPQLYYAQIWFVITPLIGYAIFAVCARGDTVFSERALFITTLIVGAALVPLLVNPHIWQQITFDIYGEMPLILWLMYPLVFFMASTVKFDSSVRPGIYALAYVGFLLIVVAGVQRLMMGDWSTVFGSRAYSTVAFAPIPLLLLYTANLDKEHKPVHLAAAILAVVGVAYSGGALGLYTVAALLLLAVSFAPELLQMPTKATTWAKRGGRVLLTLFVTASAVVTFAPDLAHTMPDIAVFSSNAVATRIHLWEAAQRMFLAEPLFGFGPAGYRFSAIQFYDPQIFEYTMTLGTDPIAYSSPSPHSLAWEVLTRLGLWGAVLLTAAAVVWAIDLREAIQEKTRNNPRMLFALCTLAALMALFATPFHFASGLLVALCAGLAIAPTARVTKARAPHSAPQSLRFTNFLPVALLATNLILVLIGGYALYAHINLHTPDPTPQHYLVRLENLRARVPGYPFAERDYYEMLIVTAGAPQQQDAIAEEILTQAPSYVSGFGPNLAWYAGLMLDNLERWETDSVRSTDSVVMVRALLDCAAEIMPSTPAYLEARERLAVMVD
ncbi:MAG: O-antigen ligase family protein [Coriobacteriia bacterium]|nr:O-antigen ligase family protein [Coriobacteriia bacterium]